jgi:hypothetical protein
MSIISFFSDLFTYKSFAQKQKEIAIMNYMEQMKKVAQRKADEKEIKREASQRLKPCKTYIMLDSATGCYKIGKSTKPKAREKTLLSDRMTIKLLYVVNSNREAELHQELKDLRVRGEWFNLDAEVLKRIIKKYKFKSV